MPSLHMTCVDKYLLGGRRGRTGKQAICSARQLQAPVHPSVRLSPLLLSPALHSSALSRYMASLSEECYFRFPVFSMFSRPDSGRRQFTWSSQYGENLLYQTQFLPLGQLVPPRRENSCFPGSRHVLQDGNVECGGFLAAVFRAGDK